MYLPARSRIRRCAFRMARGWPLTQRYVYYTWERPRAGTYAPIRYMKRVVL